MEAEAFRFVQFELQLAWGEKRDSSIWGSSVGFCADLCTSSAQTLHRPVHHAGERVAEHILTGAERVLSVLESVLCHSLADRAADRARWLASR